METRTDLICIGSELITHLINTDIHLINETLNRIGMEIMSNMIVPDDKKEIISAVEFYSKKSDILFLSGGLGPTFDDITKESVAEFLDKKLVFSEEVWEKIKTRYYSLGVKNISESNKRQAYLIDGCMEIPNIAGTAPGLLIKNTNKKYKFNMLVLLPGPPAEIEPMMVNTVIPYIKNNFGAGISREAVSFSISGYPESEVEEKTKNLRELYLEKGVKWTILAHPGIIELWAKLSSEKKELTDEIATELKEIFGISYLGRNIDSLAKILGDILKEKNLKLAVGESCTGGLIGDMITETPGSSQYFNGSFVTYSNILKKRILKVRKTLLKKYGAVSKEVAISMARGAKKCGKADVSIGVTGIAGPSGATPAKPVGLVYIALGLPKNRFIVQEFHFGGSRSTVKKRAALTAMDLLRKEISAENIK